MRTSRVSNHQNTHNQYSSTRQNDYSNVRRNNNPSHNYFQSTVYPGGHLPYYQQFSGNYDSNNRRRIWHHTKYFNGEQPQSDQPQNSDKNTETQNTETQNSQTQYSQSSYSTNYDANQQMQNFQRNSFVTQFNRNNRQYRCSRCHNCRSRDRMMHCQQRMIFPTQIQTQTQNVCTSQSGYTADQGQNYAEYNHGMAYKCHCNQGLSACQPSPACCYAGDALYRIGEQRVEPHGNRLIKCVCLISGFGPKWECFDPFMQYSSMTTINNYSAFKSSKFCHF